VCSFLFASIAENGGHGPMGNRETQSDKAAARGCFDF
jgi:hypothetical protein